MTPPQISDSTRDERKAYIRERFRCKADCDNCGNCAFLRGQLAEDMYADYIDGLCSFVDVSVRNRH